MKTRVNGWSRREDCRLAFLRDVKKLKWPDVAAAMPRRTKEACQNRHAFLRRNFTAAERFERLAVFAAPNPPAPPQLPTMPSSGRAVSTARLVADNELRDRIAELGITGGLLGDPRPGRSALDKRRTE